MFCSLSQFHPNWRAAAYSKKPRCPESFRARITPAVRGRSGKVAKPAREEDRTPAERQAAMRWAQSLKRAFKVDAETGPK